MLDLYKVRMNKLGAYIGDARRRNSQKIMDATWMRDTATKPVYVKWVDSGLPTVEDGDEVVYAKYNIKSYYSAQGDEVEYLLQFRLEDIKNNKNIKVGSYVQIENELGEPEWWLIVHLDDRPQFRQFTIFKCLHVYKWVSDKDGRRVVHECLGVPRNQNSYNSGVWLDNILQVVENQYVVIFPTNDDANSIGYDTRFLISNEGRYPPIAWQISKISPKVNGDITYFTMTQEQFDPTRDSAELMIANYNDAYINPTPPGAEDLEITYSGNPAIRAGGSYKKFTVKERINDQLIDVTEDVEWSVDFADGDITKLDYYVEGSSLKVKCTNDYSLIGNKFSIIATCQHGSKSLIVEIIGL